ncbi:MAG TPA: hypothetical protein VIT45_01105 [Allosphingosinicella sp.]
MNMLIQLLMALASAATPEPAVSAWQLESATQLLYGGREAPLYRLDCAGPELVVTQYGVTQLLDIQQNKPVGDSEGTALPAGAAFMALATDKTEPNLIPASAVRNARTGWDMTIRLPKNDPAFLSMPRAKFVSVFTTGYTTAVTLGKEDRKLLATFVGQCSAGA